MLRPRYCVKRYGYCVFGLLPTLLSLLWVPRPCWAYFTPPWQLPTELQYKMNITLVLYCYKDSGIYLKSRWKQGCSGDFLVGIHSFNDVGPIAKKATCTSKTYAVGISAWLWSLWCNVELHVVKTIEGQLEKFAWNVHSLVPLVNNALLKQFYNECLMFNKWERHSWSVPKSGGTL